MTPPAPRAASSGPLGFGTSRDPEGLRWCNDQLRPLAGARSSTTASHLSTLFMHQPVITAAAATDAPSTCCAGLTNTFCLLGDLEAILVWGPLCFPDDHRLGWASASATRSHRKETPRRRRRRPPLLWVPCGGPGRQAGSPLLAVPPCLQTSTHPVELLLSAPCV